MAAVNSAERRALQACCAVAQQVASGLRREAPREAERSTMVL